MLHSAHIPAAFGYLPGWLSRGAVVHIEVVVVVALAAPDYASGVGEQVSEYAGIVHILLLFLLNEGAHAAVRGRHLQQTIHLMAAFVVLEGQSLAVGVPSHAVQVVLVGEQFGGRYERAARLHLEYAGHLETQFVARLGILLLVEHGL